MIIFVLINYIVNKTVFFFKNVILAKAFPAEEKPKVEVNLVKDKITPEIANLLDRHFLEWNSDYITLANRVKSCVAGDKLDVKSTGKFLGEEKQVIRLVELEKKHNAFMAHIESLNLKALAKQRSEQIREQEKFALSGLKEQIDNLKLAYYDHCKSIYDYDIVQQKIIITTLQKNPDLLSAKNLHQKQWNYLKLKWGVDYCSLREYVTLLNEQQMQNPDDKKLLSNIKKVREVELKKLMSECKLLEKLLAKKPSLKKYDVNAEQNVKDIREATIEVKKNLEITSRQLEKKIKPLQYSNSTCEDEYEPTPVDEVDMAESSKYKEDFDLISYIISLFV